MFRNKNIRFYRRCFDRSDSVNSDLEQDREKSSVSIAEQSSFSTVILDEWNATDCKLTDAKVKQKDTHDVTSKLSSSKSFLKRIFKRIWMSSLWRRNTRNKPVNTSMNTTADQSRSSKYVAYDDPADGLDFKINITDECFAYNNDNIDCCEYKRRFSDTIFWNFTMPAIQV